MSIARLMLDCHRLQRVLDSRCCSYWKDYGASLCWKRLPSLEVDLVPAATAVEQQTDTANRIQLSKNRTTPWDLRH